MDGLNPEEEPVPSKIKPHTTQEPGPSQADSTSRNSSGHAKLISLANQSDRPQGLPVDSEAGFKDAFFKYDISSEDEVLDLESLVATYPAHIKTKQLILVAIRRPHLCFRALELLQDILKKETKDHQRYLLVHAAYAQLRAELRQNTQGLASDSNWLSQVRAEVKEKDNQLRDELRRAKANLIRESKRITLMELAEFSFMTGDYFNAEGHYAKARENCNTDSHLLSSCLGSLKVAVALSSHQHLVTSIARIESISSTAKDKALCAKLHAAHAVSKLKAFHYKQAIHHLLEVEFVHLKQINDIMSGNDLVIIVILCGLAYFDRKDLKHYLVSSPNFKQFMELEPKFRQLLQWFHDSQFQSMFQLLEDLAPVIECNQFLHPHHLILVSELRNRALVQFLKPYKSIPIDAVVKEFGPQPKVAMEIRNLIKCNKLSVRFDNEANMLWTKQRDNRQAIHDQVNQVGRRHRRNARMVVAHIKLHRAKLTVRKTKIDL